MYHITILADDHPPYTFFFLMANRRTPNMGLMITTVDNFPDLLSLNSLEVQIDVTL